MTINLNQLVSEAVGVVATIDPDAYAAGTVTSDWVDMSTCERIMAIVLAGTLGTGATLDAKLEQATDSSGTGAKDITGKAITQLTKIGGDDNKQAIINLSADELDVDNGYTHARLSITVSNAASDGGGIVLGAGFRYGPATDNDLASVAEVVS